MLFFPGFLPPISVLFVNCKECVNSVILSACKQICTFVLRFHSHCPGYPLKGPHVPLSEAQASGVCRPTWDFSEHQVVNRAKRPSVHPATPAPDSDSHSVPSGLWVGPCLGVSEGGELATSFNRWMDKSALPRLPTPACAPGLGPLRFEGTMAFD